MSKKFNVAVVGATGNVGRLMLNILAERHFPVNNIYALASSKSTGKEISFGDDKILIVKDLEKFDFKNIDFAFFAAGSEISRKYCKTLAKSGVVVIDNSSCFRMDEEVPLVVAEVNPQDLADHNNLIANPNCSTMQLAVAIGPLHEKNSIKRIVVSTYQSVSGAGKKAMDELFNHTKSTYMFGEHNHQNFTKPIAFNLIPHIDEFLQDGSTKEEKKMELEIKKIIDETVNVSATCVRVPVFIGHSESVNIEFEENISVEQVRTILNSAKGVVVNDKRENGGYTTPKECVGHDEVFVSRIRKDNSCDNAINMWIVSDNLRKGAALNAIQIAEILARKMS
jgi:aspartate-semialdehyde dehydrogenase